MGANLRFNVSVLATERGSKSGSRKPFEGFCQHADQQVVTLSVVQLGLLMGNGLMINAVPPLFGNV